MARPSPSVAAAGVCIVGAVRLSWHSAHGPRRARRCAVGRTVVAHTRRACWVQALAVPAIGRALRRAMAREPAGPCLGAGSAGSGAGRRRPCLCSTRAAGRCVVDESHRACVPSVPAREPALGSERGPSLCSEQRPPRACAHRTGGRDVRRGAFGAESGGAQKGAPA